MRLVCLALFSLVFSLIQSSAALSAVRINEVLNNAPGSDAGFELFELISDSPSEAMTGLTWLTIDGDGGSSGEIDQSYDLSNFSTGSNGLFLWRDNDTTPLLPEPAAETTRQTGGVTGGNTLENSSITFVLVEGFTGNLTIDLDDDNDGVIDIETLPWTSVVDAIGVRAFDSSLEDEFEFATQLGGVGFAAEFTPDTIFRDASTNKWVGMEVSGMIEVGVSAGPFAVVGSDIALADGTFLTDADFSSESPDRTVTAGTPNPELVFVPLTGDFNEDGSVDAADYTVWRDALVDMGRLPNDGDTEVADAGDYDDWKANFGASSSAVSSIAAVTAVPEPTSLAMLLLAVGLLPVCRRR